MKPPPLEPELIDSRAAIQRLGLENAQLEFLAKLMDSAFEIPGLKIRFGLDSLLGLLPGFGDFATSIVTLYIIQEAHRRGVSRLTLARMGFNVLVDWMVGTIPLAGDAFDVVWKSNQKNVDLLLQHQTDATGRTRRSRGDWLFLFGLIAVLLLALVGSLTVTFLIVSSLTRWLTAG